MYERNEDKESSLEVLEERLGISRRKPEQEVESGKPSTSKVCDESGEPPATNGTTETGNRIEHKEGRREGSERFVKPG